MSTSTGIEEMLNLIYNLYHYNDIGTDMSRNVPAYGFDLYS
jgi:hypothetical protein